jgi:alpha-D-ribose 1-methylphosphonate 5-triphosphate synthase subunit PhnH
MSAVVDDALLAAWGDKAHAAQSAFRSVLKAMSEPGSVQTLPVTAAGPAPLGPALAALCLTLFDFETPVWRDKGALLPRVDSYLRFHCGCPLPDDPSAAAFALIVDAAALSLERFAQGSIEYPDRSATLLLQVPTLAEGPERILRGPGIDDTRTMRVGGLPENFAGQWRLNGAAFPLGVDILFCCGDDVLGLPRTVHILGER